jgi:hypothetical protein
MDLEPVGELRRTRSLPTEHELLQTGPVPNRTPPTFATKRASGQHPAMNLTSENSTSGPEGYTVEGDAKESDSEDRSTVKGDDDPAGPEEPVPVNTDCPTPDSDADSENTVPGENATEDSEDPVRLGSTKVPPPISATPDQPDAGSQDYPSTVPRDENPAVSEGTVPRNLWRRVKSHIPRDMSGHVIISLRFAATAVVTSFTTYYGWNGLFPYTPSPKFLWDEPNNSIFAIAVLSFVSVLFINDLANAAYDRFRWIEASTVRWRGSAV